MGKPSQIASTILCKDPKKRRARRRRKEIHLLVFAGLFGKRVVAVVALGEMMTPLRALLTVMSARRRRGHRAPRAVAAPMRGFGGRRGGHVGRWRRRRRRQLMMMRLMVWRHRVFRTAAAAAAAAGHYHAPQVDRGRIAIAQIVVGPDVRITGGGGGDRSAGPQVVLVMVSHFAGYRKNIVS